MTNHETRALRAALTVTVQTRADGIYYVDQADLARHVKGWLEEALCDRDDIEEVSVADAVLPVLLAPVDQAAVWREAADDLATAFGDPTAKHIGALGAAHLRRRAREIEAGQTDEDRPETPLEKRLRYSERRNDELRAECKRRGKRVLEQSEKIIALEREIDEVRRQLGAEILRAGQAEAELRRLADEAAVVPPPALTEEGRLRAQVEVLQQDAERDRGLAKVGARCMRDGHQGLIEQGRLVLEGWRFALSTALDLGTGAPWEAIHERVKELTAAVSGPCVAGEQQLPSIHDRDVQGFCPACGHPTLYLGEGGHLTCSLMDCPKPEAADVLLHGVAGDQQNETPEAEREPDPDCERCDGSGLDPDAYFVEGDVWTHAPCSECLPEDDEADRG